jgi:FSR family fosmidomycin resistance protein-like MFS transporter
MNNPATQKSITVEKVAEGTVFSILLSISFSHLLNDTLQSLIPSIYPLLKETFKLSFTQVGLITLTFQMAASLLQPFVGQYTDKKPQPYSLAIGMAFSLSGLICLSFASSYTTTLISVGLIGVGSSIFHPESSKIAYMASGGKHGLAQSIFQVGGNAGSAFGPLLAALIIVPYGRTHILYFCILALVAIIVLIRVGTWAKNHLYLIKAKSSHSSNEHEIHLSKKKISFSIAILLTLIFSKYFYLSSISSYYTFYLINKFGVSVQSSQLYLFIFLASAAVGTLMGGPLGDKYGRKYVIWFSILGVAPFTLLLPYVSLFWTSVLTVLIGLILSSAFSAILVYAQELMPGKVGMVSGLFFGFAFGMGGIGSAVLGMLADKTSIYFVFQVCSFLPLIGLVTGFLPNLRKMRLAKTGS